MKTYADFSMIVVIDGGGSYPALLGVGWDNDNMEVINFKKFVMTFENKDIKFIATMDPNEWKRYIEPVKYEAVKGWDHAYKISEDYVHPTANGGLSWRSAISASSDYDDALENWQNCLHEVSL